MLKGPFLIEQQARFFGQLAGEQVFFSQVLWGIKKLLSPSIPFWGIIREFHRGKQTPPVFSELKIEYIYLYIYILHVFMFFSLKMSSSMQCSNPYAIPLHWLLYRDPCNGLL